MIFAESSHIFHFNTHSSTDQVTEKATDAHTHTHSSVTCTIQQTMQTNLSIIQDLSTSFHNRLVLALSVGVQFLWHGKIGMFLPYKNKCVEFFSLNFHNVKKKKSQRNWISKKNPKYHEISRSFGRWQKNAHTKSTSLNYFYL